MQGQGEQGGVNKPVGGMPATDDEIREKYLERAIRELNNFTRELQACERCPRGSLMPVLGSGHPQADVLLLKFAPTPAEIEEGVAFYGRARVHRPPGRGDRDRAAEARRRDGPGGARGAERAVAAARARGDRGARRDPVADP